MWWFLVVLPCFAQPSVADLLERDTIARLRQLDDSTEGVLGAAAIDLASGRRFAYHGDTLFPQASSIKIPILIEMYRAADAGRFRMSDTVTLKPEDMVGGSGHLKDTLKARPLTLTIRELVTAMMETSDNTATNQSIRMVGMDRVNATLAAFGFTHTRLQRVMLDSAAARRGEENISTPNEMSRIVEWIYRGRAAGEASTTEMIAIMKRVKAHFRKALPAGVEIASKPGGVPGVKCESGIVFLNNRPFIMSVMTTFVPAESTVVEQAALLIFRHFETLAKSNPYGHKVE
ncbi:MAG: serine hydrolase [Bryobacteraceae bacterium]|nr:serine hydrolase [Bryobacteraceae bacterium]